MSNDTTVEVRDLQKYYGDVHALRGVSFSIRRGEIVGLLGPNGAGKSTTMKILTCYMAATGGQAKVAGRDVAEDSLGVRSKVGYLPENVPLYENMLVPEYIEHMAELRRVPSARRAERVAWVIRACGLGPVAGKRVDELSKGYRQRVGLAQAIVHEPEVLILDEPTSGLDPNQIVEIRELIREIGREKTVLLSTHVLQEIEALCDRILVINNGRLVADGTVTELLAKHPGCRNLEDLFRYLTGTYRPSSTAGEGETGQGVA